MIGILIGLCAGIISGMGIGGGAILIPALAIFLGILQTEAQSINLIFFIPTGIIALITHIKNKNIENKVVLWIIVMGFFGALIGSNIAIRLNEQLLRRLFATFLFFMGVYEIFKKPSNKA